MDMQYQRCTGLDVHQRTVVACVRLTTAEGGVQQEVRAFGAMTAELLALPRLTIQGKKTPASSSAAPRSAIPSTRRWLNHRSVRMRFLDSWASDRRCDHSDE